jgi:hypothetical protein
MRDGVRAGGRGIERGGTARGSPVCTGFKMSALLNGLAEGTRNLSVEDMVGGGADTKILDARALYTSRVLLRRLCHALLASSRIFAPSTVGQAGRGQAGLGDAASDRDPGAQQAQRSSRWGANVVAKVETGGYECYVCGWCWEM